MTTKYKPSFKKIKEQAIEESKDLRLIRSERRQKEQGEVFTPTKLVLDILKKLPRGKDGVWAPGKTFLDPACGSGNFLVVVLIIKKALKHRAPLKTIYGVDIMEDNVAECKERLLRIAGNTPTNRAIVDKNIVCADGLTYDYLFEEIIK